MISFMLVVFIVRHANFTRAKMLESMLRDYAYECTVWKVYQAFAESWNIEINVKVKNFIHWMSFFCIHADCEKTNMASDRSCNWNDFVSCYKIQFISWRLKRSKVDLVDLMLTFLSCENCLYSNMQQISYCASLTSFIE